jgi:hypothetical protein
MWMRCSRCGAALVDEALGERPSPLLSTLLLCVQVMYDRATHFWVLLW